MIPRIVALAVLLATPSSCASTSAASRDRVGEPADLKELMCCSAEREACTATYRATGTIDQTVRFTCAAPDRMRLDTSGVDDGRRFDESIWIVGDRWVRRSSHGDELECADLQGAVPTREDWEAIGAALGRAFPSSAGFESWFEKARRGVLLSMSSGFLERITDDASKFELVDTEPIVDESVFTVASGNPGANDASEKYRRRYLSLSNMAMNHMITEVALEARQRDSIADEDFTNRLSSVFDVAYRRLRRDRFAQLRDSIVQFGADTAETYRRQRSATAADPDLRESDDEWIALQRQSVVESLQAATEADIDPDSTRRLPPASADQHVAELIAEARRRSLAAAIESEVTRPSLAYFDEQVRAVQSKR